MIGILEKAPRSDPDFRTTIKKNIPKIIRQKLFWVLPDLATLINMFLRVIMLNEVVVFQMGILNLGIKNSLAVVLGQLIWGTLLVV